MMQTVRSLEESDPDSEANQEKLAAVHQEFVDLALQYLSLAKSFLEMSKTARKAADNMVRRSERKDDPRRD
jgi:hypothetical protein